MSVQSGPSPNDLHLHVPDVYIDFALRFPEECTEEVVRKGIAEPCEKPAVALRVDPREGGAYAVCMMHTRAPMMPLARIRKVLGL